MRNIGVRTLAVVAALGIPAVSMGGQNSNQDAANDATKAKREVTVGTSEGKIANTSKNCEALTGKEYDQCIQATPAGPADLRTGEGSKAKSELAKERDGTQAEAAAAEGVPAQSQDSLGHPEAVKPTGEAQSLQEPGAGKAPVK